MLYVNVKLSSNLTYLIYLIYFRGGALALWKKRGTGAQMSNTGRSKVLPWIGLALTLISGVASTFVAVSLFPGLGINGGLAVFAASILLIDPAVRYRFGPFR